MKGSKPRAEVLAQPSTASHKSDWYLHITEWHGLCSLFIFRNYLMSYSMTDKSVDQIHHPVTTHILSFLVILGYLNNTLKLPFFVLFDLPLRWRKLLLQFLVLPINHFLAVIIFAFMLNRLIKIYTVEYWHFQPRWKPINVTILWLKTMLHA